MPFLRSALFVAVLASFSVAATAEADECKLKQFASVPVTFARDGRILLDVSINGEPARLLLDTGASASVLDQGFVTRRNLPAVDQRGEIYGLTGKQLHGATRVNELKIGNAVAPDQIFRIGQLSKNGNGPDGVFGTDFLGNFDVEIDPTSARVNLFMPGQCPGHAVYWAKEYFRLPVYVPQGVTTNKRIVAVIKVDGVGLHGLIDTGAAETTMRLAIARDSFDLSADGQPHAALSGIDGTQIDTFAHSFKSLTFGDITLNNPKMLVADIDTAQGRIRRESRITGDPGQPDVLIGMSLLRKLHLLIAYGEQTVYFTLAEPKPQQTGQLVGGAAP